MNALLKQFYYRYIMQFLIYLINYHLIFNTSITWNIIQYVRVTILFMRWHVTILLQVLLHSHSCYVYSETDEILYCTTSILARCKMGLTSRSLSLPMCVRVCFARAHLIVVLRRSRERKGESLADKARDVWVPAVLAYHHKDQKDCITRERRRAE